MSQQRKCQKFRSGTHQQDRYVRHYKHIKKREKKNEERKTQHTATNEINKWKHMPHPHPGKWKATAFDEVWCLSIHLKVLGNNENAWQSVLEAVKLQCWAIFNKTEGISSI